LVRDARFEILPACGHSTYFEDAASFNRLVGDFVARRG
jgi:pimeloyl-ACP methyl ester carboxylesterase